MKTCTICGRRYTEHFLACPELAVMKREHVCFTCAFWKVWVRCNTGDPSWLRIGGVSYYVTSTLQPGERAEYHPGKGFGGQEFFIETDGDRLIRTDNLWCQGNMPEWIREDYPDNARFITHEEYWERIGGERCEE